MKTTFLLSSLVTALGASIGIGAYALTYYEGPKLDTSQPETTQVIELPKVEVKMQNLSLENKISLPEPPVPETNRTPVVTAPTINVAPNANNTQNPDAPDKSQYQTINDFEANVLGMCPQDIPQDWWPERAMPSLALGLTSTMSWETINTPQGLARQIFNEFKSGRRYEDNRYFWILNYLMPDLSPQYHAAVYVNWSAKSVYYANINDPSKKMDIPLDQQAKLDSMMNEITVILRKFDTDYTAKCGEYPITNWSYNW